MPRCLARLISKGYSLRCSEDAICRVRLFESDGSTTDIDYCHDHAVRAGGEYPDNIKELILYDRDTP